MLPALLAAVLVAAAPSVLLRFDDPRIAESSALVLSSDGERLYTANDSGDAARLFSVDFDGRTRAVVDLPGVEAVDVEDAARGPGGTVYLADTGDNRAVRDAVQLVRLREPGDGDRRAADVAVAALTYEDGAHDAEALLVHPRTGQTLVVTKGLLGSAAYEAPQPFGDGVLRRVGGFAPDSTGTPGGPDPVVAARLLVTGGAVSPDGSRLVLRTYTDAYVFAVPGDDLVAALRGTPAVVALPASPQGEAVTWTRDGKALLTSSEGAGTAVDRVPVPAAARAGSSTPSAARATPSAGASAGPSSAPTDGLARRPGAVLLLGTGALLVAGVALLAWLRRRE